MPIDIEASRRSVAGLDLSPENSGIFTPGIETIEFSQAELRRFNDLAHQLNGQMQPLSADQVAGVARRVLRTHAAGGESPFIRSRMRRAAEIQAMRGDPRWTILPELRERVDALIGYLQDSGGLLPDVLPVIGLLDDALLVDIAMDDLRPELDEYAEYLRYVQGEAARRGVPVQELAITRSAFRTECEHELRLERQLRRAREGSYASSVMDRVFRVC